MPWKGEKDPYKIWLSEVILQQTRVEQGLAYYERFVDTYPSILALAHAPDDAVFKLWEGLGYYSRCRNLLHTAREIAFSRGGEFPRHYAEIISLKGIGAYTAAAIASFAYDQPYAVVDGNVIRVLTRYFGILDPVDLPATRARIQEIAEVLLDQDAPAAYNQAIMDFGATICKPRQPLCNTCPLGANCAARKKDLVEQIPKKARKTLRKQRYFHYIIFAYNDLVYVRKRTTKDIWNGLFEFYLVEKDHLLTPRQVVRLEEVQAVTGKKSKLLHSSPIQNQQLTHQDIHGIFLHIRLNAPPKGLDAMTAVKAGELHKLAFPRFIVSYMREFVVI